MYVENRADGALHSRGLTTDILIGKFGGCLMFHGGLDPDYKRTFHGVQESLETSE